MQHFIRSCPKPVEEQQCCVLFSHSEWWGQQKHYELQHCDVRAPDVHQTCELGYVFVQGDQESHESFESEHGVGVLQTLPSDFNLDAISLLGKRSGFDVDKTAELDSLGVEREDIKVEGIDRPISIFKNCISFAVMMVDRNQPVIDLGDHDLVIMTPRQYFSGHPGSPLTTQYLRDRGVI